MSQTVIYLIFTSEEIGLWSFFSLEDVINLAATSQFFSGLMITNPAMHNLITKKGLDLTAGRFKVSFPNDLTIGHFSKVLSKFYSPSNIEITINVMSQSGRVVLDLGSVVNGIEDGDSDEEVDEAHMIHKHIEVTSCDEFDDFEPRHPVARGAHRRGDSYFNSDVDAYANDIQPIHKSNAFDMSGVAGAMPDDDDENSPNNPNSVKNRLLQRKGGGMASTNYPGKRSMLSAPSTDEYE
jgi:hypothetical protein